MDNCKVAKARLYKKIIKFFKIDWVDYIMQKNNYNDDFKILLTEKFENS